MRFTESHLREFRNASGDRNPLHFDVEYCRKSYFGSPVVYGMASVFYGLGLWAKGRPFALESIRGSFNKPLFLDQDYDFKITENNGLIDVRIFKGPVLRCGFECNARLLTGNFEGSAGIKDRPELLSSPREYEQGLKDFHYMLNEEHLAAFSEAFGLSSGQLPKNQLSTLMGLSYLVGMVHPGQRGLFAEFEVEFDQGPPKPEPNERQPTGVDRSSIIEFKNLRATRDERYNRVEITGQAMASQPAGVGHSSVMLAAFTLPEPFQYRLEWVEKAVGRSTRLSGQTVLITGGSRGLGSVLAKAFALQGANIALTYQSSAAETKELLSELSPLDVKTHAFQVDLSVDRDCAKLAAELEQGGLKIDILIDNAFPSIPRLTFAEQKPAEITEWIGKALKMSTQLLSHLLPALSPKGTLVYISSIVTQKPEPQLSHYAAVKSAVEGMLKTMAKELPKQRFIIIRPTRMLTNSSNLSAGTDGAVSPVNVARELLDSLTKPSVNGNLYELNIE